MNDEKKKARQDAVPFTKLCEPSLLFLFVFLAALGGFRGGAFGLSLCLGLFHRLLGLGGFLGASFGALFLLLVENLLAAEQFQKSLFGPVPLVPPGANGARVAAVAVAETGANRVKQLHEGFVGHEVTAGLTARSQVTAFAKRDHLLDQGARSFCLGNGRLDSLFHNHGGDQIAEQRAPVRGVSSEFVSCNFVTHFKPQGLKPRSLFGLERRGWKPRPFKAQLPMRKFQSSTSQSLKP